MNKKYLKDKLLAIQANLNKIKIFRNIWLPHKSQTRHKVVYLVDIQLKFLNQINSVRWRFEGQYLWKIN